MMAWKRDSLLFEFHEEELKCSRGRAKVMLRGLSHKKVLCWISNRHASFRRAVAVEEPIPKKVLCGRAYQHALISGPCAGRPITEKYYPAKGGNAFSLQAVCGFHS